MILKLQEDKITAEQQLAEVSVIYSTAKVDVCVFRLVDTSKKQTRK